MSRSTRNHGPCPFCGRITRTHSRIELADVEAGADLFQTRYATVICRDCAFAMVLRSEAAALRGLLQRAC